MKTFTHLLVFCCITNLLTAQTELWPPAEESLGQTYYDLQTWRTMQNRIFYFDDGTIGAVWNMGMDFPGFNDLGIGYNYFDGNTWSEWPSQSIASVQTENPSYTDYGENGEICASQFSDGLCINWRENKGAGLWQEIIFLGDNFLHPCIVTTGPNNEVIHLLYLKADNNFEPTEAQPYRGFIWYARSTDGMQTWDINIEMPGLGPDNYLGFTIGAYAWAEPKEDALAFVAGDYLTDLVLMKSNDGGETWQKTIIWEHPYPMFEIFSFESDSFYCNNGGITIALDNELHAQVAFGLNRVFSQEEPDSLWYCPEVGGIAYWREGMSTFSNNLNALNPYGHPDSELTPNENLIAWMQDINGNGQIDTLGNFATYPTPGLLAMPQLVISEWDAVFLVFNSISETYSNGMANYRHLWVRSSYDNGNYWGNFYDLNTDLIHIFDECIFPSVAPDIHDDELTVIYTLDHVPGIAQGGSQQTYSENFAYVMHVELWDVPNYLNADFSTFQTSIYEGDTITFQNLTTSNPATPIEMDWTFEGGNPENSNELHPTVIYNQPGTYDVSLTATTEFMTDTEVKENYINVLPIVQMNEPKDEDDLQIYPNPGHGKFTIDLISMKNQILNIAVFNILGAEIFKINQTEQMNPIQHIDLADQSEGIYFLQYKTDNKSKTIKLLIQH